MSEWMNLIVVWLAVGVITGGLAGLIVKRYGLSIISSLMIGLSGAIIGGVLFGFLYDIRIGDIGAGIVAPIINVTIGIQIGAGLMTAIINAAIGAVVLLVIYWVVEYWLVEWG